MQFLDHNMKILKQVNPELLRVINSESKLKLNTEVGFGTDENQVPVTVVVNSQGTIVGVDAEASVEPCLPGINPTAKTIIVYGFGLGYFLDAVIKKYPDKNVICIEPDRRILYFAFHLRDMSNIIKNVTIWTDEEIHVVKGKVCELIQNPTSQGTQLIQYSGLYPEYQMQLFSELQAFLSDYAVMVNTKLELIEKWYTNRTKNLSAPSVNAVGLISKFEGIPAIIVGAGPSLQSQLETIRSLQGKAVIIAVSTATEILTSNGIVPTFFSGIDADPSTSGALFDNSISEVPLLFDGQLAYNAMEYKGKKFRFRLNVNKLEELINPTLPLVESGPSIGNATLDLLVKFGCNPILLTGFDLSYTDNKLYCEGTRFNEDKSNIEVPMMMKDNHGNLCKTEPSMLSMKSWFETYCDRYYNDPTRLVDSIINLMDSNKMTMMDAISTIYGNLKNISVAMKSQKKNIINCTARGVPIANMPNKTLESCVEYYDITKDYAFEDIINSVYNKDRSPDFIDTNLMLEETKKLVTELESIKNTVIETKEISPSLMNFRVFPLLMEFLDIKLYVSEVKAEVEEDKSASLKRFIESKVGVVADACDQLKKILEN